MTAYRGTSVGLEFRKKMCKVVAREPFLSQKAGSDDADKGGLRCREHERFGWARELWR